MNRPAVEEKTRGVAGNKEFIAMVTAFMALGALAIDIMIPAFPDMRREFGMAADSTDVGWIITAFFLGGWSPTVLGDYVAGPSHTLPTGGAGRSFAGLTVDQFQRRTSVVEYSRGALRKALGAFYPQLDAVHLVDYKVRILDGTSATGAKTRVVIDSVADGETWSTMGVGENIISASAAALEATPISACR